MNSNDGKKETHKAYGLKTKLTLAHGRNLSFLAFIITPSIASFAVLSLPLSGMETSRVNFSSGEFAPSHLSDIAFALSLSGAQSGARIEA